MGALSEPYESLVVIPKGTNSTQTYTGGTPWVRSLQTTCVTSWKGREMLTGNNSLAP